jgi:hypothetical protein
MTLTALALAALLQAPKSGEASWQTFTSAGGFSVTVPGTPVDQKQNQAGPSGPVENFTLIAKDGDIVYLVMKIHNPGPIPKELEDQYFRNLNTATTKSAKLMSEKVITHAGHPGREYDVEVRGRNGETLVARYRYILTSPDVTFNMQVIRAKDKPAPNPRDVARFFDSLKVVDAAMARRTAQAPSKLAFKPFAPPKGGFTGVMPGQPTETTSRHKTANGSFAIHAYECNTALGFYGVSVFEYGPEVGNAPAASKNQMLVSLCDALVAGDKGKALQQDTGQFQGCPARMVRFSFPAPRGNGQWLGESRAVMLGARVFVISVRAPADGIDPADPEKFFESFKLTEAPSPAPGPAGAPEAQARRGRSATGRMPAGAAADGDSPAAAPARAGRAPARRTERITWKRFNSAAGGFSVQMPGETTPTREADGLLGAKDVEVFTAAHGQAQFVVQYQDLPRSAMRRGAAAILKSARNSDANVIKGKVVGEKEAPLKGAVGSSYQIEAPGPDGLMARVHSYLVGPRLYQVIVAAPKPEFPTDDSERFFRSFRLQGRN